MSAEQEQILEKVKKLFALAGNNPNEQEAALALAKAQEILAKYNLSMAQLDEAKEQPAGTAPRTKQKVERSAMFAYQRKVWQSLAEANFCVYWSQKLYTNGVFSTYHHFLIGSEENVVVVRLMGEYVETTINRLCPYNSGKDVNLWKTGCADRIAERLQEKRRGMEEESRQDAGSTAVTVTDVHDRETHANHVFQHGSDSWCPCRRCYAVRSARREAERRDVIETISQAVPMKAETEAQRRKREEREERQHKKWREKYYRRANQEYERVNSAAYLSGRIKGDEIGLDKQVNTRSKKGDLQ